MGEFDLRGAELKKLLKIARAQPIFFAYNPGNSPKEDYFGVDRRKPAKTIFKTAKEQGSGKKVAFGTARVEGKLLCLTCDRELPSLAKKLKKYLTLEKIKLNLQVVGPDGTGSEDAVAAGLGKKGLSEQERLITLCNSGVVACKADLLFDLIDAVDNTNASEEYYLTDIVGLARERGLTATAVTCDEAETIGINSRGELARAEAGLDELPEDFDPLIYLDNAKGD